jgi:putative endonuclease
MLVSGNHSAGIQNVIPSKEGIQRSAMNQYYVYIMASKQNGTLYIGVTNNLTRSVYEHKNDLLEGFTKRYSVHLLVFYEVYNDIFSAIEREKKLKKWNRSWKIELIEKQNPEWFDLYTGLI